MNSFFKFNRSIRTEWKTGQKSVKTASKRGENAFLPRRNLIAAGSIRRIRAILSLCHQVATQKPHVSHEFRSSLSPVDEARSGGEQLSPGPKARSRLEERQRQSRIAPENERINFLNHRSLQILTFSSLTLILLLVVPRAWAGGPRLEERKRKSRITVVPVLVIPVQVIPAKPERHFL